MISTGKILIVCGIIMVVVGLAIQYFDKIPFLGKLPGDFLYEKGNTKIYFPLATSILLSILLSFILYIINQLKG